MSRLDSFIRRLLAQRACLDWAAQAIEGVPGPVLELGLGNGRTYDHLRERLPGRDVWVFERRPAAHSSCRPAEDRLFVGDLLDTLPGAGARIGVPAALAHADLGSGVPEVDRPMADFVARALPALMREGGIVLSDAALSGPEWEKVELPPEVPAGRYFAYRRTPGATCRSS